MVKLLEELRKDPRVSRSMFIDMLKRNKGIEFELSSTFLTTLPTNLFVDDLIVELSNKIEATKVEHDEVSINDEIYDAAVDAFERVKGLVEEIDRYSEHFKTVDVEKFKLVHWNGSETINYNDSKLTDVFIEEELLLSRSKRKDDTSRYIGSLNIETDISLFEYVTGKTDITLIQMLRALKRGDVIEGLRELRDDLERDINPFIKKININKIDKMLHNDLLTVVRLLQSITEF